MKMPSKEGVVDFVVGSAIVAVGLLSVWCTGFGAWESVKRLTQEDRVVMDPKDFFADEAKRVGIYGKLREVTIKIDSVPRNFVDKSWFFCGSTYETCSMDMDTEGSTVFTRSFR